MARTANASLVGRLHTFFDAKVRARGHEFAQAGKVRIQVFNSNQVVARVSGDRRYKVHLQREDDELIVNCSCSYIHSELDPCEHIWATIIVTNESSYLRGPSGDLPSSVELHESVVNDEVDEEYYEEWEDDTDNVTPATVPFRPRPAPSNKGIARDPAPAPVPPPAPVVPPWRQQLKALHVQTIQQAQARVQRTEPFPPGRELLYVINIAESFQSGRLVLEVLHRDRKMNGEWSKPRSRQMTMAEIEELPDRLDRHILGTLTGANDSMFNSYYGYSRSTSMSYLLPRGISAPVVELACQTGRCVFRSKTGEIESHPLAWDGGGAWDFCLTVRRDASGKNYELSGGVRRGDEHKPIAPPIRLLFDELMFMDDRVARLRYFGGACYQFVCANKIMIPVADGTEFITELLAFPNLPKLDLPDELRFDEISVVPRPCLKVRAPTRNSYDSNLLGSLTFDYDGTVIPNDDPRSLIVQPDRRRLMRRVTSAEVAAYNRLRELGFKPASYWTRDEASLELIPKRLPRAVNELLAAGWHVEAEGKLYRQPGAIQLEVSSGIDWFELNGSVSYGDTTAKLPALLAALKRGDGTVLLDDGTLGMMPDEWLKKYGVLAGLGKADGDALRFHRNQVGLLDALLASQPEATCDELFTRARHELTHFQGIKPREAAPGFVGTLRPYQCDGLGWIQFLQQFSFGGCLADDMGLGKTVQVLALLESRRELRAKTRADTTSRTTRKAGAKQIRSKNGDRLGARESEADTLNSAPASGDSGTGTERPAPSLVVVPKSLVFNWKQEAARFAPQLRVLDHTGIGRLKGTDHFKDYDVVLTTYGTLRRDAIDFKDADFDYVILDEAQAVKNANTESAKAVRLLRGAHRLALSGTPVENHLGELWSLFDFLNPGMLGAASVLRLGGAGARNPDQSTRELLARALRPFILRRTKEQVATDLPAKLEQTIFCELEPDQRKLYNELRDHYRSSLLGVVDRDGINKSKIQILEALLRLRQAACHPGLIDKTKTGEPCAKLDVLLPQLDEVIDEGHKVLVFSQFTSMLAILRQRLDAQKIPYEYLDGKTADRQTPVERFQTDPKCRLFLISLKAGGLGLNLTAAEYVFLLDPWWNPAVESQAIDRAHRIGQTRQVFAYRLIARDTVEEKVLALQETKRNLADAIINADNSLIRKLNREDLELLLS